MAVTLPRCWGWQSSVSKTGELIWANELPKPRMNRPATYTGSLLALILERFLICGSKLYAHFRSRWQRFQSDRRES